MAIMLREDKQRFNLKTAYNVRNLGGYKTDEGFVTSERFIRADCFVPMYLGDTKALIDLGVRTVIDLRNQAECDKVPSGLSTTEVVKYISLPIFPENQRADFCDLPREFTLSTIYIDIVEHRQEAIRAFFKHAATEPGRILFHCSAGKDRTGVIAALLLKLAGVDDITVVQDYALTEVYLKEQMPALKENSGISAILGNYADEMFEARPANMQRLLTHITDTYSNAKNYLQEIGVHKDEIESTKSSMLERTQQA